jgi:hypothetical protein
VSAFRVPRVSSIQTFDWTNVAYSKLSTKRPIIIARPGEVVPHSINGRTEEVLAALVNNPTLQIYVILCRILAIREADGIRRVMLESLSYDSINTRAALADELVLAARKVMVARPACDDVRSRFEISPEGKDTYEWLGN